MVTKGKDLMIFQKVAEVYKALASATNHTLSISAAVMEASSKDSGKWGDNEAGRMEWEMGTENLFVQLDFDTLFKAMVAGEKLIVAFEIASNANNDEGKPADGWAIGDGGYEGEVLITSLNANAPNGENATYSATFKGCGPLMPRTKA
ncbi:phage tail protein [Parabacteroides acidifaciens]|uniref:Phage tail protein n=1 Tax=Parabacteroides acidifaciens TaxID=2290935 RepID=A0A3D8HAT3_9BACT|nr:phage tail tube protein [Parabacteroides acidifaciens]MBC8603161.1 phage tail protein [Parabacteroides acidifaciens]RDU48093.1 phage tail protein [Parabacteroides acidifaciens]